MENKTAQIVKVEYPEHWHPFVKLFKVVHVQIGSDLYEFSQVHYPTKGLAVDSTIIWRNYDSQDRLNWDGKTIGLSDMSIEEWLISEGYEVSGGASH